MAFDLLTNSSLTVSLVTNNPVPPDKKEPNSDNNPGKPEKKKKRPTRDTQTSRSPARSIETH